MVHFKTVIEVLFQQLDEMSFVLVEMISVACLQNSLLN